MTPVDQRTERFREAVTRLIESVEFDVNGSSGQGGNGGLISDKTIRAAGDLRILLSRHPAPSSNVEGDDLRTLHSETTPEGGVIRLSKWPEGYVLWYHGKIVWRAWANSNALLDVAAERRRQVEKEGWSPEHDDAHVDRSLAKAAAIYTVGATLDGPDRAVMDTHGAAGTPGWMKDLWPWDIAWWKPTDRRRDLVKAAALIIAEIDRLDRALALATAAEGKP